MLSPGDVVASRYKIERFLASGGMGAVFVAHDASMDAKVALKVSLAPPGASDLRRRFEREARIAHRLGRAAGIVRALDWGELPTQGGLYLVLDLVPDAKPLDLATGSLEERLARLLEATRIIERAHRAGVVHRDLKPQNFLVAPSGELWLTDFGIAKLEGESDLLAEEPTGGLTATGDALGTPLFMAPEQFEDAKHVDARADVFALGVMLYVAATGHNPFVASSVQNLIALHGRIRDGRAPAPRPRDRVPELPDAVDALVARALAVDRTQRVASAADLAAGIELVLGYAPTRAPEKPPAPRGSAVVAESFGLVVVPILAGKEWIDETTFVAVEEWERWRAARRQPGAMLEVSRLRARRGDRGPLRLPQHRPFIEEAIGEAKARGPRWRAWPVLHRGTWAVFVRTLPDGAEDEESWSTAPEAEGGVWSAPVAHDTDELREALKGFRAADHIAREPVAAYKDALDVLGRLRNSSTVIGAAIPEAYCAGCALGSFHGLLAALARGDLLPGAKAELVLRAASREVRVRAQDLEDAWRCPSCGGEAVRIRFAHAWDEARGAPSSVAREVQAGDRRVSATADPLAAAVRLVREKQPGDLVLAVAALRAPLDALAGQLRAAGLPDERVVRRTPLSPAAGASLLGEGDVDCLLLEVGDAGPPPLELDAFREVPIVVLDPQSFPARALDALERAVAARRRKP